MEWNTQVILGRKSEIVYVYVQLKKYFVLKRMADIYANCITEFFVLLVSNKVEGTTSLSRDAKVNLAEDNLKVITIQATACSNSLVHTEYHES